MQIGSSMCLLYPEFLIGRSDCQMLTPVFDRYFRRKDSVRSHEHIFRDFWPHAVKPIDG